MWSGFSPSALPKSSIASSSSPSRHAITPRSCHASQMLASMSSAFFRRVRAVSLASGPPSRTARIADSNCFIAAGLTGSRCVTVRPPRTVRVLLAPHAQASTSTPTSQLRADLLLTLCLAGATPQSSPLRGSRSAAPLGRRLSSFGARVIAPPR